MKLILLLFLAMPVMAQSIKVESVVEDIQDFQIVAMSPCLPPHYAVTAMCVVIRKDDREYMAIHDINTKELIELRSKEKQIWHRSWMRT